MVEDKKLHNRFDQYEIASVFTEYTEEYLSKKWKVDRKSFYLKCLLGTLLFINGYLSHWGPWPWPTNYYFLIFSVIFYHSATYLYSRQSPIKNAQGNTVGQYKLNGSVVAVVVKIGESKQIYTLQTLSEGNSLAKHEMPYYEYFTESGAFLSYKFKKVLKTVMEVTEKSTK